MNKVNTDQNWNDIASEADGSAAFTPLQRAKVFVRS